MPQRRTALALIAFGVVIAGALFWWSRAGQPSFEGRRWSEWLSDMGAAQPEVRERARAAFRAMGSPAVRHLVDVIEADEAPCTAKGDRAYNALIAMATEGSAAWFALLDLLDRPRTAMDAALSLAGLESSGLPVLTNALTRGHPAVRTAAAAALGTRRDAAGFVIPALRSALNDPLSGVRQMTVLSLGEVGVEAPGVLAAVMAALSDQSAEVRASAAKVLGRFGPRATEALPALRAALNDASPTVRAEASTAVKRIATAPPGATETRPTAP